MNQLSTEMLLDFWSSSALQVNLLIFMNLFGALLLGCLVGYERAYHGRAAGMRTYGLVCMASAALTVLAGFSQNWYAGHGAPNVTGSDPTRIIQGIVTGIGFLGAGVIMKEGMSISGLTTAASIWASSAIGIMVGVGFYAAAIMLALLSALCMLGLSRLESRLPQRPAIGITLRFDPGFQPDEGELRAFLMSHGFDMAMGSISITYSKGSAEWRFVAIAHCRRCGTPMIALAQHLEQHAGIKNFNIVHARN
jgi:putative Mg2+ transporter-C (MgtC) family protein